MRPKNCAKADYLLALLRLRAVDHRAIVRLVSPEWSANRRNAIPRITSSSGPASSRPVRSADPTRLVELAKRTVESSPEDPDYLTACGAALYRAGRWDEAQTTLTEAVARVRLVPRNS